MKPKSQTKPTNLFSNFKPAIGEVLFAQNMKQKDRRSKLNDFKVATYLKEKYGGTYVVLKESNRHGIKMPDLLRNGNTLIEIKRPTTLTGIDSRIHEALKQLPYQHNEVKFILHRIIFIDGKNHFSKTSAREIKNIINHRINRSNREQISGVIIKRHGRKDIIIEYQKPPHLDKRVGM